MRDLARLDPYLQRSMEPIVNRDLRDFRAVMVRGPRQSGKSTLVRHIARASNATYVNLDFSDQRTAAIAEPNLFVEPASEGMMVIDEVQRGGENLLLAIKASIDRSDRRGQFLLTGSANYLTLPTISESLQGRIAIATLFPFSQGEINESATGSFVDTAFDAPNSLSKFSAGVMGADDYWEVICSGGYPEIQSRGPNFRTGWFRHHIETTISREIADLGNISNQDAVAQILAHCAALSSNELNIQSFVRVTGLARQTVNQYISWLAAAHLVQLIPAWRRSLAQRQIKSQKILLTDSGIACHLVGKDTYALSRDSDVYRGQALETFVGIELLKQLGWSAVNAQLFHWRTVKQSEVDYVIEASDGRVVGIEVKASTSPGQRSGRWLAQLRDEIDRIGGEFVHGYVLHLGERGFPLGDRLTALPVESLWSTHTTRPITALSMNSGNMHLHQKAVNELGKGPAGATVSVHLQPQNPGHQFEFSHGTRDLQNAFQEINELCHSTLGLLRVRRGYLSYHVVDIDFSQSEFTCGKLRLDGSATWVSPISVEWADPGESRSKKTSPVYPTHLVFGIVVGLKAVFEWAKIFSEISGDAAVSVQFHAPHAGAELDLRIPIHYRPHLQPDIRAVQADLPPLAINIDLESWARDPSSMLRAARYFSEHLLAAFGYERLTQITAEGEFSQDGIEQGLRADVKNWSERTGIA